MHPPAAAGMTADLGFGDFVFGQLHYRKVSFSQGANDLIEADLQGPALGRAGLRTPAGFCHDHHGAASLSCSVIYKDKLPPAHKNTGAFLTLHLKKYVKF